MASVGQRSTVNSNQLPLFEYGIQTEQSDIRAHVSVVNRTIYVFRTVMALRAMKDHPQQLKTATQQGVLGPTANGMPMPIENIPDLRRIKYPKWPHWDQFRENLSTSEKGSLAVKCVLDCMRWGFFPFWVNASEDDRENVQLKGTDILVFCRKKVQVKCDYCCGDKPLGTGNIYLQTAERNPRRMR